MKKLELDLTKATERLITALQSKHISIRPEYLRPGPLSGCLDLAWVERTPLFYLILDTFDIRTYQWFEQIVDDAYSPDWHVVYINPDVSPLGADDWRVAAPSLTVGLASVLAAMAVEDVSPIRAERESDSIVIWGEEGQLAAIERIRFECVPETARERAITALKGVRRWGAPAELESCLRKLQGYGRFLPTRLPSYGIDEKGECLYLDARNLCTTMMRFLSQVVDARVPRHFAQEVLAVFFGVPSWQHFTDMVNRRQAATQTPHMLVVEDRNYGDYQAVRYARGLPKGVYLFGQSLRKQERTDCTASFGTRIHLCNFTETDSETFKRTGERYVETRGIAIREMHQVDPDPDMCKVATAMLGEEDISDAINHYLFTGQG